MLNILAGQPVLSGNYYLLGHAGERIICKVVDFIRCMFIPLSEDVVKDTILTALLRYPVISSSSSSLPSMPLSAPQVRL